MEFQFRKPIGYADPISLNRQIKWNPIISAFMEDQLEELEVTLSENSAYKKLFRYGHHASLLNVV